MPDTHTLKIALGGGCFWCVEAVFKNVRGVLEVQSGYSNGQQQAPSYEQVCSGTTGCAEVVLLSYDPNIIELEQLLEIFFLIHNPTELDRQGPDVGSQYRSAIFTTTADQLTAVHNWIGQLQSTGTYPTPIVTQIAPLAHYWPAENYHQDYFEKNPTQGYCMMHAAPKVAKFKRTFAQFVKD